MTLKVQILKCSRMLFIILVSLTMTSFSENFLFPLDADMVSCPTRSENLGRTLPGISSNDFNFFNLTLAQVLFENITTLFLTNICGVLGVYIV